MSEPRWVRVGVHAVILVAFLLMLAAHTSHAEGYTTDDTLAAIDEASDTYGVSHAWLTSIVSCETAHTFNPYAVGRAGELGAVQLHPRGELPRFFSWGYTDPFSPYQAVAFLAQRLLQGGAHAWTCA